MPIVRISLAMKQLAPGEHLQVEATDRAFYPDRVAWTQRLGHKLVSFEHGETQRATILKGGNP